MRYPTPRWTRSLASRATSVAGIERQTVPADTREISVKVGKMGLKIPKLKGKDMLTRGLKGVGLVAVD